MSFFRSLLGLIFYFAVALAERLVMPWRVERGPI